MIVAILLVLGLCLGSFVNALVWRLHEQARGGKKQKAQSKKDLSILKGRSMCPDCKHSLAAGDLIPVVSWLMLKGKCRYCRKPISWQYPAVELATASLFLFSYAYFPYKLHALDQKLDFVFWLIFLVGFMALTVYDLRWYLLPDKIVYPLYGVALLQVLWIATAGHGGLKSMAQAGLGLLIGGGLFYVLFQVSKGKWIGGGDVKLGGLLGLVVGSPSKAILMLFVASLAGTVVALPLLVTGRAKRTSRLPFGPFLILAAIIVYLFGGSILDWYSSLFLL